MSEAFDRQRTAVSGESGLGDYGQIIVSRRHVFTADEPNGLGGSDTGPDPIELLLSSLASCTAMTLRMYAKQKRMEIGKISVAVTHQWVKEAAGKTIDHIQRNITIDPQPEPAVLERLLSIAEKCPVHRALSNGPSIETGIVAS